ncbi:MAG: ATPase [Betaproteobacteria bacterium SG8_40]|nr:MAG: ATPase [Betaproteobacteria bacterium SG8_40]
MNDQHDLTVILRSRFPIVAIETHEEARVIGLLERICNLEEQALFVWTVTDGLSRHGRSDSIPLTFEPVQALRHIYKTSQNGIYTLLDLHPFLDDPINQRLIKSIANDYQRTARTLVLVSHRIELPSDISRLTARFSLSMPDADGMRKLAQEEIDAWSRREGTRVKGSREAGNQLVQHLVGMSAADARRLVRHAIHDDGAITSGDIARVLKFKHEALGADSVLTLELETAGFSEVAGQSRLKQWLAQRKAAFVSEVQGLEPPRGIMLLGVQGAGKSLAAKAVAGSWGVPLMRLDCASLYEKWIGETERNLREALRAAEAMAPCVLWMDEIEKGLSADSDGESGGTSRRLLGTLLTWMAERKSRVFLVATANDIQSLPPELIRKGRMDEIFFVDLPDAEARAGVFRIHLRKRDFDPASFDIVTLATASEGFSGAEIEQSIVAALYEAHARGSRLSGEFIAEELSRTRPLSVVARERIQALREWARHRAVMADG